MMNERIQELAEQAGWMMGDEVEGFNIRLEKFAELIVRECIDNLEFHGFDDAIPYIEWMAKNKLGTFRN